MLWPGHKARLPHHTPEQSHIQLHKSPRTPQRWVRVYPVSGTSPKSGCERLRGRSHFKAKHPSQTSSGQPQTTACKNMLGGKQSLWLACHNVLAWEITCYPDLKGNMLNCNKWKLIRNDLDSHHLTKRRAQLTALAAAHSDCTSKRCHDFLLCALWSNTCPVNCRKPLSFQDACWKEAVFLCECVCLLVGMKMLNIGKGNKSRVRGRNSSYGL